MFGVGKVKLKRKKFSKIYYGKHAKINTNDLNCVFDYLNELNNYINKFKYKSDPDFIFCGRKQFVYEEILRIINGEQIENNPVYFILGSLEEFLLENFVCTNDCLKLGITFNELRDANDRYIIKGIICLEEIEYFRKLIKKIELYLFSLNCETISKGIYTLEDTPWIKYFAIDEDTLENKLREDAPDDIKIKYYDYINNNINLAFDILYDNFDKLSTDIEISVLELLGNQSERYDDDQLNKIAMKFFDKYKDKIEIKKQLENNLIYYLPFIKK